MSQKIGDILRTFSQRDMDALKSIYSYRCLSLSQIYELHYKKSARSKEDVSDMYCRKKISDFSGLDLIEKTVYGEHEVFFLTSRGVDVVKSYFDLPANIYDGKKQAVRRGYYRASELKISDKYINHQVHTNQFLIDFAVKEYDILWKYYDEKHISHFTGIRPDGLLAFADVDFFIEMDMGTESKKQICDKWVNYRNFLNSSEYHSMERKIVMLFVIEGVTKIEERINLVKHTIADSFMDAIDSGFDVYVNTSENLLKMIEAKYIVPLGSDASFLSDCKASLIEEHGFDIAPGHKVTGFFNGMEFSFYGRRRTATNTIIVENNKVQEYVFDEYSFAPFSVLKKIAYLEQGNLYFRQKFAREISYVVIVESEKQIYYELKMLDLLGIYNVYYTTLERLKEKSFHEALFQFDAMGNIHFFKNSGLNELEYEINISELLEWWEHK